jgi:hypothetical protein
MIAGCATLPEYRDEPPTTREVIRNVKCELQVVASNPKYEWLKNEREKGWSAKLNFTFEIIHSGDLSTDNTWGFPLNMGATFNINFTGQFTGSGTRKENVEFNQGLQKLADDKDFSKECAELGPGGRFARLGGHLGIADLIERAHLSRALANNDYEKLTYDLEYTIKKNATLTPRFNLVPIGKEKTYTGNAKWTGSNSDTQKLALTFSAPAKSKACSVAQTVALSAKEAWPDPDACPTAVYVVDAKMFDERTPCANLNKAQCNARSKAKKAEFKCIWEQLDPDDDRKGTCTTLAQAKAALKGRAVPPAPRRRAVPEGSGVDPVDRARLDDAFIKRRLESIESDVSRQRLGN